MINNNNTSILYYTDLHRHQHHLKKRDDILALPSPRTPRQNPRLHLIASAWYKWTASPWRLNFSPEKNVRCGSKLKPNGWKCWWFFNALQLISLINSHGIHVWYIYLYTYIYHKNQPNVNIHKYTIHGSYGIVWIIDPLMPLMRSRHSPERLNGSKTRSL